MHDVKIERIKSLEDQILSDYFFVAKNPTEFKKVHKMELANKCGIPKFVNSTWLTLCYKLIQRFRVTGLFTDQYTTGYYGTFTDVIETRHIQLLHLFPSHL